MPTPIATAPCCAVCGGPEQRSGMSRVVIEGRALSLCRAHAATVATEMPETFEDLRMLFVGLTPSATFSTAERDPTEERRSPLSRRAAEDRRVFPPRPEGRRASTGRRAGDLD